jgi:hypothetical protein
MLSRARPVKTGKRALAFAQSRGCARWCSRTNPIWPPRPSGGLGRRDREQTTVWRSPPDDDAPQPFNEGIRGQGQLLRSSGRPLNAPRPSRTGPCSVTAPGREEPMASPACHEAVSSQLDTLAPRFVGSWFRPRWDAHQATLSSSQMSQPSLRVNGWNRLKAAWRDRTRTRERENVPRLIDRGEVRGDPSFGGDWRCHSRGGP